MIAFILSDPQSLITHLHLSGIDAAKDLFSHDTFQELNKEVKLVYLCLINKKIIKNLD